MGSATDGCISCGMFAVRSDIVCCVEDSTMCCTTPGSSPPCDCNGLNCRISAVGGAVARAVGGAVGDAVGGAVGDKVDDEVGDDVGADVGKGFSPGVGLCRTKSATNGSDEDSGFWPSASVPSSVASSPVIWR